MEVSCQLHVSAALHPEEKKTSIRCDKSVLISKPVVVPWGNHALISNSNSQYKLISDVTEEDYSNLKTDLFLHG